MLWISATLCALCATSVVRAAPGAEPQAAQRVSKLDPIAALDEWRSRHGRHKVLDPEAARSAEVLVAAVRSIVVEQPERRPAAFVALLDTACLLPRRPDPRPAPLERPDARAPIVTAAYEALERALELYSANKLEQWLANELLTKAREHPVARRRAALEVLIGKHEAPTLLAILECSRASEPDLREFALRALVGWDDAGVHRWMLEQLETPGNVSAWTVESLVRAHFSTVALPAGEGGSRLLYERFAPRIIDADWRVATRALEFFAAVDDELAVPALIHALELWLGRAATPGRSRRVEGELVAALRKRTGATIGALPDNWRLWWQARLAGRVSTPADRESMGRTQAGFFGLRPVTDRVTFVLDRSRSMLAPAPPSSTRYAEAIRQMSALLRDLGPRTRFRVVLFADKVQAWKDVLQPATPENIASAELWAAERHPDGGTELREAVESVLRLDRRGTPDLARLEEDTVIVLCDGATAEGPQWVKSLFERVGAQCCVAFHCVQIGAGGDGTLEDLARWSGGEYRAVDG